MNFLQIPCYFFFSEMNHDKNSISRKMRWATIGYHHNWDTKVRYVKFLLLSYFLNMLLACQSVFDLPLLLHPALIFFTILNIFCFSGLF